MAVAIPSNAGSVKNRPRAKRRHTSALVLLLERQDMNDRIEARFERLAQRVTHAIGTGAGFAVALAVVVGWAVSGPLFGFSDTWQLVINTGTTIVTFLVVFLIQRTQNKDAMSLQLKLNELVAAMQGASNRLIDAEDLSERELKTLQRHYRELANLTQADERVDNSHSVEEARARHRTKSRSRSAKRRPGKASATRPEA